MKPKNEDLAKYDELSEAKVIHDSQKVFKKSMNGRKARHLALEFKQPNIKDQFLQVLKSDVQCTHVYAHGYKDKDGKGCFLVRNNASIGAEDIKKPISLNACETWTEDLAAAFLEACQTEKRV